MDDQHAVLFPLFVSVIVETFDEPTATLPNAKLPDSLKIRVSPAMGEDVGDGAVGEVPPPPQEAIPATPPTSRTATNTPDHRHAIFCAMCRA